MKRRQNGLQLLTASAGPALLLLLAASSTPCAAAAAAAEDDLLFQDLGISSSGADADAPLPVMQQIDLSSDGAAQELGITSGNLDVLPPGQQLDLSSGAAAQSFGEDKQLGLMQLPLPPAPQDLQLPASLAAEEDPPASSPGAAAPGKAEQSVEQAFLSIRKQMSKAEGDMTSVRQRLGQALQWGHQVQRTLLEREQNERLQMKHALEVKIHQSDAAVAAAMQREHSAEAQLKGQTATLQQQAQTLAQLRQELAQRNHDYAAAEQAWRAKAARMQQDSSAQAQASMRWLRAAQRSKDVELNESKVERAKLVKMATAKVKQAKAEEGQLKAILQQERQEAKGEESQLSKKLEVESRDLEEAHGREGQLRRQLATFQRVARAEIQKLRRSRGSALRGPAAAQQVAAQQRQEQRQLGGSGGVLGGAPEVLPIGEDMV